MTTTMQQQIIKEIPLNQLDLTSFARFSAEVPESEELEQLINSIKSNGTLQPIIVRPNKKGKYDVIAGNRRVRASRAARVQTIPAIVTELDDIHARRIAFNENMVRLSVKGIEGAKCLAAMYEDVGIPKEIAIQKVHKILNEKREITKTKNIKSEYPESTEFLEVFNQVPLQAMAQWKLLQLVTKLPEPVQDKVEETQLSTRKATLLTNSALQGYPEIQEWLTEEIKDMTLAAATQKIQQTIADLKEGLVKPYKTESGDEGISHASHHAKPKSKDEPFDTQMLSRANDVNKLVGKFLKRPLTRGEVMYEPKMYEDKLEAFKQNISSMRKDNIKRMAVQCSLLMRILKIVVDAAR